MKMRSRISSFIRKIGGPTPAPISSVSEQEFEAQRELNRINRKYTYGDQKGQVDFLINNVLNYEKNGLMENGFFVDLACADGVTINNTYFLEEYLGFIPFAYGIDSSSS